MTSTLYPHQQDAVTRMVGKPAFMQALDAGTGKSRILIEDMARIARLHLAKQRPLPAFLLIAPSGVHDESWPTELDTWWPSDVPMRSHVYHSGEGKRVTAARHGLTHHDPHGLYVTLLVMHYEALSATSGAQAAEAYLHAATLQKRLVGLILDEIHFVKTPGTTRTRVVTRLAHKYARVRRGASGTLVGKGHEDLFAPYRILDPTCMPPTFTAFKAEYCIEKSMGGRYTRVVGYRNVEALYDRVASLTLRVSRDACLALPDRQIIDREIPMTAEQERLHKELTALTMSELRGGLITATEAGTRLIRFAQIAGGFVARDDDPTGHVTPVETGKVPALAEILTSYGDAKVIVWGRFHADIDRIVEACEMAGASVLRHDGRMPKDVRDAALTSWRTPDGPRVLAATMQTLGIGRTLNEATLAVFYSLTFDRVIYEQTLARNYRAGQREKVVVIRLLVKKSADESMRASLLRKDAMQQPLDLLRAILDPTPRTTEPSCPTP